MTDPELPLRGSRTALRRQLRQMARSFAEQLLDLLDEHGYWDEREEAEDTFRSKRVRRTDETLDRVERQILDVMANYSEPVAISVVAEALGLSARSISHPLARLVEENKVIRSGERRGARYLLARPKRPTKRPPRAKAPPKKRKPAKVRSRKAPVKTAVSKRGAPKNHAPAKLPPAKARQRNTSKAAGPRKRKGR